MKQKEEGHVWRKGVWSAAAACVVFGLAACGGGDDGAPAANPSSNNTPADNTSIKVSGTSQDVTPDASGNLAVMAPAMPDNHYGQIVSSAALPQASLPVAALLKAAPGAYTGFDTTSGFKLTNGVVTDLAGNGQYAIGRWADGGDSSGANFNANQGRMWAVATPLKLTLTPATPLDCKLEAATLPVAIDGNTAPGKLDAATAAVRVTEATGGQVTLGIDFDLGYSIGQDTAQSRKISLNSVGFSTNRSDGYTTVTRFVGKDASAPYLLLSYTFDAPTAGTISGVAALACASAAVPAPDNAEAGNTAGNPSEASASEVSGA